MRKYAIAAAVLAFASTSVILAVPAFSQPAGPTVVRKTLQSGDAPGGNTISLVEVTIPPGGNEGRHVHSGPLVLRVLSGELTLDYEGKPTTTYKAGDTFIVETGKQHEGHNRGTVPMVAIAAFSTPKGAPLTTQVTSNGK
jgi:quercetin dioxygenase-like cupin family protein